MKKKQQRKQQAEQNKIKQMKTETKQQETKHLVHSRRCHVAFRLPRSFRRSGAAAWGSIWLPGTRFFLCCVLCFSHIRHFPSARPPRSVDSQAVRRPHVVRAGSGADEGPRASATRRLGCSGGGRRGQPVRESASLDRSILLSHIV